MSEPNPAPAPWQTIESGSPGGNGDFNLYVMDRDQRKIAAVWGKRGEKEWTGALIAAAPDLLAACKAIDELVFFNPTAGIKAALRQVRAAIRKVEGAE